MIVNNVQIDPQVFDNVVVLVRNAVGSVVKPTGVQMRGGGVQSPAEMAAAAARDAAVLSEKERREMEGDKPAAPKMEQDPEKLKAAAQKYLDGIKKAADKLKAKNAKLKARGLPELPGGTATKLTKLGDGFEAGAAEMDKILKDPGNYSEGDGTRSYAIAQAADTGIASVQKTYNTVLDSFKSDMSVKFGQDIMNRPEWAAVSAEFTSRSEKLKSFADQHVLAATGDRIDSLRDKSWFVPTPDLAGAFKSISSTAADSAKNYLAQVYAKLSVKPQKVKVPKAVKK